VNQHTPLLKHAGDIGATIASAFVAASHWAELATPILSFFIALATAAWWAIRFVEWRRTGKLGD
jgi:hypothetical protein